MSVRRDKYLGDEGYRRWLDEGRAEGHWDTFLALAKDLVLENRIYPPGYELQYDNASHIEMGGKLRSDRVLGFLMDIDGSVEEEVVRKAEAMSEAGTPNYGVSVVPEGGES